MTDFVVVSENDSEDFEEKIECRKDFRPNLLQNLTNEELQTVTKAFKLLGKN